jgi:hypothetical protein
VHAPECLHGTRQAVRSIITDILSDSNGFRICWLQGKAGSGKSAVAKSIADHFSTQSRLAASFFFSRGISMRSQAKYLFPTIALQLTVSIPSIKSVMAKILRDDPYILDQALRYQFRKLIVDPISKLEAPHLPMAIVIDAIDECDDDTLKTEIISLITDACANSLLFTFLFTSRPDPYIRAAFTSAKAIRTTVSFALQCFNAHDDVLLFLRDRYGTIFTSRRTVISQITSSWPTELDIEIIAKRCSGLFIFAATVMNFIGDKDKHPVWQLEEILKAEPSTRSSPYAALDQLYSQILSRAPHIDSFRRILGVITVLFDPLPVNVLEDLLSLARGDASLALEGLHSILSIPDNVEKPVTIYHDSLRNFLMDSYRSNDFFVVPLKQHDDIVHHCLKLMTTKFEGGVCVLNHSELFDSALWYSCDYWGLHLNVSLFSTWEERTLRHSMI